MRFTIKLLISLCVIVACTQIGRKVPTLAGLVAVMPLTGFLVLVWLYWDNPGNFEMMVDYTRGALWGIIPSVLFFLTMLVCFKKNMSLPIVVLISFAVWFIAAALHQLLLNK